MGFNRSLFADEVHAGPVGLFFWPDRLSEADAREWLDAIGGLTLAEARYKDYTARRRVASFGGRYDYEALELREAPPIPPDFQRLIDKLAFGLGISAARFAHLLLAEYRPGTPLGWHRDVPDFESIVGVSLQGTATMKFRPHPHQPGDRRATYTLELPPRSVYVIESDARWRWQHSVAPTTELRYSATMRTRRATPLLLGSREQPIN